MQLHSFYGKIATFCMLWMMLVGCGGQTPDSHVADSPVVVKTVAVQQIEVQQATTQPATVHAFYRTEIRAKASGFVSEVTADIGDVVAAGTILARLAVPEMLIQREILNARISRYQSEEARAQAGLRLARATIESAKARVQQSVSEVKQAMAPLTASEAELDRTKDLVQRQSLQSRVLDEVVKKRDSAVASKDAAESAIRSAEADVLVAEAKLSAAEADWNVTKTETEIARRQLEELDVLIDYAEIKAPFRGVVTKRTVDQGDLVTSQSEIGEPLFVVSQIDRVRIHILVPEVDAARVNQGDEVSLSFPSFPAESISATVTRLSGELDPSTRTMLVEAELANPDGKFVPGMFGQAAISGAAQTAAMLPARAVRFDESGKAYVYAVNENTISVTEVTTGIDNGRFIEVVGLGQGQRVVDAHLKRFTDGQRVVVNN